MNCNVSSKGKKDMLRKSWFIVSKNKTSSTLTKIDKEFIICDSGGVFLWPD